LLREFESTEVRKLGVRVSNLEFSQYRQLRLDEWTPPEWAIRTTDLRLGQQRLRDYN
jgi:hypothetical protein